MGDEFAKQRSVHLTKQVQRKIKEIVYMEE